MSCSETKATAQRRKIRNKSNAKPETGTANAHECTRKIKDEPRLNTDLRVSVGLASEAALHECRGFTPYHRTFPYPRISAFIRG
jgi:nucleotidyltransferase/DNA polymerase involved in DNA repair